jgi:hypothetical protein
VSRTNTIASPNAVVVPLEGSDAATVAAADGPSPSVSAARATAITPPISMIASAFCMRDEPLRPIRLMLVNNMTAPAAYKAGECGPSGNKRVR